MDYKFVNDVLRRLVSETDSAARIIEFLREDGYERTFVLDDAKIICLDDGTVLGGTSFEVDQIYNNEDVIEDKALMIFAITHPGSAIKGILITEYS